MITIEGDALTCESWALCLRLRRIIDVECYGRGSRSTFSVRKERLKSLYERSYSRFERRVSIAYKSSCIR